MTGKYSPCDVVCPVLNTVMYWIIHRRTGHVVYIVCRYILGVIINVVGSALRYFTRVLWIKMIWTDHNLNNRDSVLHKSCFWVILANLL